MATRPSRRAVAADLRYTRIVVAFGRTLTSLVLVTALAGSPALVSACLVACLPASTAAAAPAPAAAHEAVAAAHAHHGGGADVASSAAAAAVPSSHHDARVDGECHDCCASASNALDTGVAGERPAAVATALTPGSAPAHPALIALTPDRRLQPPSIPPPAPVRASLVLRI